MIASGGKGMSVNVSYLEFSDATGSLHHIFIDNLVNCRIIEYQFGRDLKDPTFLGKNDLD